MINNIVFDIGNVLVRWSPLDVIHNFFGPEKGTHELTLKMFKSPLWFDINLGKITERQLIEAYHQQLGLPIDQLEELMIRVKESLTPIEGSLKLLDDLYVQGIPLYSITDNVPEIMQYLRNKYDFFHKFSGIVVSADIGILKPSPGIYKHLLESYNLIPQESVFIDDLEKNVQGAKDVGLHGIHFQDATQCRSELRQMGVKV